MFNEFPCWGDLGWFFNKGSNRRLGSWKGVARTRQGQKNNCNSWKSDKVLARLEAG